MGCDIRTARRTVQRHEETGKHENRTGRGRKAVLSIGDKRAIYLNSARNRTKTIPELTFEANITRTDNVSQSTVNNALAEFKIFGRVAARKPLLRKSNIKNG